MFRTAHRARGSTVVIAARADITVPAARAYDVAWQKRGGICGRSLRPRPIADGRAALAGLPVTG